MEIQHVLSAVTGLTDPLSAGNNVKALMLTRRLMARDHRQYNTVLHWKCITVNTFIACLYKLRAETIFCDEKDHRLHVEARSFLRDGDMTVLLSK